MIIRVVKDSDNPYVQINKKALQDKELSWQAKGLLSYLLSLPNDWQIYQSELVRHSTNKIDSLRSIMQELENSGYIEKEEKEKVEGKFQGFNYIVYESKKSTVSDFPTRPDRHGSSDTVNPTLLKNNKTNNNKLNIASSEIAPETEELISCPDSKLTEMILALINNHLLAADIESDLNQLYYHPETVKGNYKHRIEILYKIFREFSINDAEHLHRIMQKRGRSDFPYLSGVVNKMVKKE